MRQGIGLFRTITTAIMEEDLPKCFALISNNNSLGLYRSTLTEWHDLIELSLPAHAEHSLDAQQHFVPPLRRPRHLSSATYSDFASKLSVNAFSFSVWRMFSRNA